MLLALFALGIAGAGAWLLALWALNALVDMADKLKSIWPLAYYAYGALMVLAIPSACFGVVVGLKSFRVATPGGGSAEFTGDDA